MPIISNFPGGAAVDTTLAVSGKAADAATVGSRLSTINSNISALDAAVSALGASTTAASTAAAMTDTSKIYVYTGSETGYTNGNWYYYDGSAWVSGGAFNASGCDDELSDSSTNAVQNKVVNGAIDDLKSDINSMEGALGKSTLAYTVTVGGSIKAADGTDNESTTYSRIEYVDVSGHSSITVDCTDLGYYYYLYDASKSHLSHSGWHYEKKQIEIGNGVQYIRVVVRHPLGTTQTSPTELEVTNNITIYGDIIPDVADRLRDAENNVITNTANIERNATRIAALEAHSGAIYNDFTVVEGGSIVVADGSDTTSSTYSRVEYLDISDRFSITVDPGALGAYIYTYTQEKEKVANSGWVYAPTVYHCGADTKYMRIVMRYPIGQTQVSPTVEDVVANLKITAMPKEAVSNERMRQNFLPAKSSRYIYAKGKMWEYYWNTVNAVKAAAASNDCWGVSVDVRVTSDGYFVCYHDPTVDDQTDGTGQIEDMTWAQVQALNINKGVWNGTSWVAETDGATGKIPLLSDVIDACRLYGKIILIEPKTAGSSAISNLSNTDTDAVVSLLREKGMVDSCAFIAGQTTQSFLEDNHPEIFRVRLYDGNITESAINAYCYDPNTVFGAYNSALTSEIVNLAHSQDHLIIGYTPRTNPQSDDVEMVGKGLDGVLLFREPPVLA